MLQNSIQYTDNFEGQHEHTNFLFVILFFFMNKIKQSNKILLVVRPLVFCVAFCRLVFVFFFLLAIVLSVLLPLMDSDCCCFCKLYEYRQMCATVIHLTLFMILCTDLYYLRHSFSYSSTLL